MAGTDSTGSMIYAAALTFALGGMALATYADCQREKQRRANPARTKQPPEPYQGCRGQR